eukprot:scaffold3660_cov22-Cyclotella_meneghiniana.AAC.2
MGGIPSAMYLKIRLAMISKVCVSVYDDFAAEAEESWHSSLDDDSTIESDDLWSDEDESNVVEVRSNDVCTFIEVNEPRLDKLTITLLINEWDQDVDVELDDDLIGQSHDFEDVHPEDDSSTDFDDNSDSFVAEDSLQASLEDDSTIYSDDRADNFVTEDENNVAEVSPNDLCAFIEANEPKIDRLVIALHISEHYRDVHAVVYLDLVQARGEIWTKSITALTHNSVKLSSFDYNL